MRDFVLETDFFFFSNFLFNLLEIILLYKICCFQWFKDTNLKANHNKFVSFHICRLLFPMVQRY